MDPLSAGTASREPQPSTSYQSRGPLFRQTLATDAIPLRELKALAYGGVPEEDKGLRAVVWKASKPW